MRAAGYRADTSLYVVDGSRIKWAWLQSLAVHHHSFVLKRGIKLARLSFTAVWQVTYRSYIDYSKFSPHNQPFELHFQGQLHMGAYSSKH